MWVPDSYALAADAIFSDAEKHAPESWNLSDILTKSSNVGTIMIAQRLKAAELDHYLRVFGLGQKTALAFPNESGGILPSVSTWTKSSMGSIPIGQGVAVTAIQMLQAFNVIAAGGDLVSPTTRRGHDQPRRQGSRGRAGRALIVWCRRTPPPR